MDHEIDLLQIKIDQAKAELPAETLAAIAAVDWKGAIFSLREKKGYNFEQLGDLETETELLLCGLLSPADYPRELEKRMRLSRGQADELVATMNDLVFRRIREEMIKNEQKKKSFAVAQENKVAAAPARNSPLEEYPDSKSGGGGSPPRLASEPPLKEGNNKIPEVAKPELTGKVTPMPILEKKLAGPVQSPPKTSTYTPGKDPYRLPPE